MARWYSEDPDYTQISTEEKNIRDRIVAILDRHTKEMEGYDYCGNNPGVSVDDYEDVADDIMQEMGIK
jgi:hypothetical protein